MARRGADLRPGGHPRFWSLSLAVSVLVILLVASFLFTAKTPIVLHQVASHMEHGISGFPGRESKNGEDAATRISEALRARHYNSAVAKTGVMSRCPPPPACDNTCPFANNGVCNDGSLLTREALNFDEVEILCDLGTDCNDCGKLPATISDPKLPYSDFSEPFPEVCKPVAYLRSITTTLRRESPTHEVTYENSSIPIYIRRTQTKPPILLAYTDWKTDVDVSSEMHNEQMIEARVTRVAAVTTEQCCKEEGKLMLDIGSNFGYYAFLSAAQGCRVEAWEPVPTFRAFLLIGLFSNGLGNLINVHAAVAGAKGGEAISMTVPTIGIWGTAGVDGMNIDGAINDPGKYRVVVGTERVGDSIPADAGDICLVKLDVEGYEPEVFEGGLLDLFRPESVHPVKNLLIEYNAGVYERNGKWKEMYKFPMFLWNMQKYGYTLRHMLHKGERLKQLDESLLQMKAAVKQGKLEDVHYELPPFDEINKNMVARDIGEAARYFAGMGFKFGWEAHPISLRSAISYNTDIWASRASETGKYPLGSPAGLSADNDKLGVLDTICDDLRQIGPPTEIKGRICMTLADGHAEEFRKRVNDAVEKQLSALPLCNDWLSLADYNEIQALLKSDLDL